MHIEFLENNNNIEGTQSLSGRHVWEQRQQLVADSQQRLQMQRERTLDGFLDFKIFIRLMILELKLIVFTSLPSTKDLN